jgi:hypothetical protein
VPLLLKQCSDKRETMALTLPNAVLMCALPYTAVGKPQHRAKQLFIHIG